jgi:tRNA modification GTPase
MFQDTIAALATASGVGAIGVIRVSGPATFAAVQALFKGKNLQQQATHTVHFGTICQPDGQVLDEVLLTLFKGPKSFTKEDVIEISCHGSPYIIQQILQLLIGQGVRMALPGEFTQRAFLNGQFDLAQAEAVADVIAANSAAAHQAAMQQLRGGFSKKIAQLREQLIHFASMIELELDFGEEDVTFANRSDLQELIVDIEKILLPLIYSFRLGNALKNGIPTVIVGKPNAGKSTLLNQLLNEERAIVSDIAGTTRDVIEDELVHEGIRFRLIDTAGLRPTQDQIEAIGVQKAYEKASQAQLLLYVFDAQQSTMAEIEKDLAELQRDDLYILLCGNKMDLLNQEIQNEWIAQLSSWPKEQLSFVGISAKDGTGLNELLAAMKHVVWQRNADVGDTVVTSLRHFEHLSKTHESLQEVSQGIDRGVTGDFLAQDIRLALHHLGEITGSIAPDDLLANIFSRFCIGK